MAHVGGRRSRPNPLFDRHAEIPEGFKWSFKSDAPMSSVHEVPLRLRWMPDHGLFDFGEEDTRISFYGQVLYEGSSVDVVNWVQPAELVRLWDQMSVTAAINDVWDPWVQDQGG